MWKVVLTLVLITCFAMPAKSVIYFDCETFFNITGGGVLKPLIHKKFLDHDSLYLLSLCDEPALQNFSTDSRSQILGRWRPFSGISGLRWALLNLGRESAGCGGARVFLTCNPVEHLGVFRRLSDASTWSLGCGSFELIHSRVCGLRPAPSAGLSTATVVWLCILVVACCYLAGGLIVQRCVRGKRGINQIPNLAAWQHLGNCLANCCDLVCRSQPRLARSKKTAGGGRHVSRLTDEDEDLVSA